MKIWDFFKSLFNKSLFNKFIKLFKQFIEEAFDISAKILIGKYKELAIEVVEELNNTDLTNSEKRKEAFKKIKDEAKEKGDELRDSLINTLIELAVQYVKKLEKGE